MNNKLHNRLGLMLLAAAVASPACAQDTRIVTPRAFTFSSSDANSARIGVMLGDNGVRDTAGVLVNSVVAGGPAEKAGLKEGDRIQAINGVNLKMAHDDADDAALAGMMSRRLTRELDKLKAGDEVELRVLSGSASKTVRIKTVAAHELNTTPSRQVEQVFPQGGREDRAALGLGLGWSSTKRDTLGVFVASVVPDGPAEKAGVFEGDRIARINNIDLRVPSTDAGDSELAQARLRRFTQEVGKLKAGDAVTLSVVSGGRTREVKLNTVKASELKSGDGFSFFFGDGAFTMPHIELPALRGRIGGEFYMPKLPNGGTVYYRNNDGVMSDEVRATIERAMQNARAAIENARKSAEKVRAAPIVKRSVIRS